MHRSSEHRRPGGRIARSVASALRRCRNEAAEEGSAVVEFVFLGLMLLVPVVYFVLTVSALQGASFAATGAADHAAKTFAQAGDEAAARGAAQAAVELAMSDFGLAEHSTRLEIGCDRTPCLQAGGAVKAIVRVDVPLPFSPVTSGLGLTVGRIEASATQIVGRFR